MTNTGSTPPPDTPSSGLLERPITPVMPVVPRVAVSPRDGATARQRRTWIVALLLLAVAGGLIVLAWPRAGEPAAPTGEGALGAAPDTSSATAGSSADASAGASAGPSTTAIGQGVSFLVSSRVTSGLLNSSVEITVRNVGRGPAAWHSVKLAFTGGLVPLGVSSADSRVTYSSPESGVHCMVAPDGVQSLNAGEAVTFTASVNGVVPATSVRTELDSAPCPT